MKKLILACASLLAFSEVAVGETVTNDVTGVVYSYTNSDVTISENGNKAESSENVSNVSRNDDEYSITLQHIKTYSINNYVRNVSVTVNSFTKTNYTIESFSKAYSYTDITTINLNIDNDNISIVDDDEINKIYTVIKGNTYDNYKKFCIKSSELQSRIVAATQAKEKFSKDKDGYDINDDLYYVLTGGTKASKATNCYPILCVYGTYKEGNSYDSQTCKTIYNPTIIPFSTNVFSNNKSIKKLTLCASISTIEEKAFVGASNLTEFDASNNSYFKTDNNGLLYTDGYAALVAVPAGKTGDIKLHDNCSSIYDYACANVSNVNLISTSTSVSCTTLGGSGNKVTVASATLTTNTANGGVTATANQVLTQANVNKIIYSNGSGRFIDLSSCVKPEATLTISGLGANCLLFLPAGTNYSASKDANIVVDDVCENFVMTDGTNFFSPKTFTAKRVEYQRTFKETWGTLCLPFTVPTTLVGNFNNVYQFASMSGYTPSTNTFQFTLNKDDQALQANVPYVFKRKAGATDIKIFNDSKESGKHVTVNNTSNANPYYNGSTFHAAFTASTYTSNSSTNYYGFASGNLVRLTSANVPAFRCYISAPVAAAAPEMRFVDEDGFDVDFSDNETEIEAIEEVNTDAAIYNVNGQQVSEMTSGMYIVNGKKVTVK